MKPIRARLPDLAGLRIDPLALGIWLVPAAIVVYLALRNGGYDPIPRGEVGVLIWWIVPIGVLAGALPVAGRSLAARVAIAVLVAFAAWTALSLGWTESDERTMIELGRVATYLGIFVLAVALQQTGRGRHLLGGVSSGIAIVVILAAASRLEPSLFPEQTVGTFIPDVELERRLAYPLNYSSGLAALTTIGLPLLLCAAAAGRTTVGRALAAAALPIAALTLWLTGSSLALPLAIVGLLSYLALTRDRLAAAASLVLAALGGTILIVAAERREALDRGLPTPEALRQGDEMLVIVLVVVALTIVAQRGLESGLRRWRMPRLPTLSAGRARALIAGGLVAVVAIGLAAGGPGELSDQWSDFKSPEGLDPDQGARGEQLLDVSSRGRYQYWESAVEAYETEPWTGIGPGTFEFWWAREGTGGGAIFVRDAHSLYLQTLAELGIPGFVLILAFVAIVLSVGTVRTWRVAGEARPEYAAAMAGCWVFAAAAAVDWMWQLAAVATPFLLLAAIGLARDPATPAEAASAGAENADAGWKRLTGPALIVALSIAALVAIAIPLAGASAVEDSREAAAEGQLDDALGSARDAVSIQPYAATPRLQEALILERLGQFDDAADAASAATRRESTNWRPWLVLSRLEARSGDAEDALDAYVRARSLFPRGVRAAPE